MTEPSDVVDALVATALRLAADRGWRTLSLVEVATDAGIGLADAYRQVPSKAALLAAIIGAVDRQVLAAGPAADGDTPRDRLFEILMRHFDALQAQRQGYLAILNDAVYDPLVALPVLPDFARSMAWTLDAAAIDSGGVLGNLRTKALGALYLTVLRTWRSDDSLDLARTMAALDRELARLESWAGRCPRLAGSPSPGEGMPPPSPAETGDSDGCSEERPSDV